MKTGEAGKQLIRDVEKLGPHYDYEHHTGHIIAYLCPAKRATIGYGHTKGVLVTDVGVREINLAQAESFLTADCEDSEKYLNSLKIPNLNQNQYDALISLIHNVGSFGTSLTAALQSGSGNVPALMKRYIHSVPGSEPCKGRCGNKSCKLRIEPGLITRREAEVALFTKPIRPSSPGVAALAIPLVPLILGAATWLSTKACPAMWHHHTTQPTKVQVELARDLCEKHNDCSVERTWAMPSIEQMTPEVNVTQGVNP